MNRKISRDDMAVSITVDDNANYIEGKADYIAWHLDLRVGEDWLRDVIDLWEHIEEYPEEGEYYLSRKKSKIRGTTKYGWNLLVYCNLGSSIEKPYLLTLL
jgi:hypothetical protein